MSETVTLPCYDAKHMLRVALLSIIALGIGTMVVASYTKPPLVSCVYCNIIIVSLDGLGYGDITPTDMPFLSSFRDQAFSFSHAYSQAPWMYPSAVAMLTGTYPWDLGIWQGWTALPFQQTTLARTLQDQGYRTAAFSSGLGVQPQWNMDQGFDEFTSYSIFEPIRDAPLMFADMNAWIRAQGTEHPFFSFLNSQHIIAHYKDMPIANVVAFTLGEQAVDASVAQELQRAHRQALKEVDDEIARMMTSLEEMGLLNQTIVVFTSTSGNTTEFDRPLSLKRIHVPLIMYVPNTHAALLNPSVEIRSLADTLYEIVGVHSRGTAPLSLVSIMQGTDQHDRKAQSKHVLSGPAEKIMAAIIKSQTIGFGYWQPTPATKDASVPLHQASVVQGDLRAIEYPDNTTALYDIQNDPDETHNLLLRHPSTFPEAERQRLMRTLETLWYIPGR